MIEQTELRSLAEIRLQEAACLLHADLPCGAYYLAGLAIELAIKACIAGKFPARTMPDKKFVDSVYSHELGKLFALTDLEPALKAEKQAHQEFNANWEIVLRWNINRRYKFG